MGSDPARDGIAPDVSITPAIHVEIRREQPPRRYFHDDGTVSAFMQWVIDTGTYPLAGTTACGPGFYVATFEAEHREAIEEFLRDHGYGGA